MSQTLNPLRINLDLKKIIYDKIIYMVIISLKN